MDAFIIFLFLAGGCITILAQLYIAARAFRAGILHGLFCLFLPAYNLYYVWRRDSQKGVLWVWGAGFALFMVSAVIGAP